MSDDLPSGWRRVSLREIAQPVKRSVPVRADTPYRTMGVKWWGEGAYERETKQGRDIKAGKLFEVQTGDLVINRIWVRHGSSGIIDESLAGCVVTQDFPVFRLDMDQVITPWLRYMFKTAWFWQECDTKSRGTSGRQRINPDEYLDITIPLPPLTEQQRIVAKLDALRTRVEQALALQGAAIAEAEALILANSATIFNRRVEMGDQIVRIDDCCSVGSGLQKSPARRPKERPTPYLRVANVQRNYLDLSEIKELEVTPDELERLRLLPGDVLVVEGNGSLDNIGRTALWRGEIEDCVHQNHIIRLRPDTELVSGEYVNAFLNSPLGRKQAVALSVTTSGLYVLSAGKVRQIRLPLPSSADQQAIVEEMVQMQGRIQKLIDLQTESEKELQAMLPAVQDRAFRGEF